MKSLRKLISNIRVACLGQMALKRIIYSRLLRGQVPERKLLGSKLNGLKLHIGCADNKLPGYINVDIRKTRATDVITEAWNLSMFGANTVASIYCRHAFEHLDPNEAIRTLVEWRRVLVDGGTVNIIVPDLDFHCRQLLERSNDSNELNHALAGFYGWRDESRGGHAYDAHKWGYTEKTLTALVVEYGFVNISRRITGADSEPRHLNLEMAKYLRNSQLGSESMNEHLGGHANITHLDEGSLNFLKTKYSIGNMLDIGCGPGGMRAVAKKLDILWTGIDGDPTVNPTILHDFSKGQYLPGQMYDLGWSVEFVEHVEERYIKNFMSAFTSCKLVVITASPPGTPGYHHVNCRTQDYWVAVFAAYGFRFDEELTKLLKKNSTMEREFIRRSGMVFVPWT